MSKTAENSFTVIPDKRGIFSLERLLLLSEYPFGFFRFSRTLHLGSPLEVIVYPAALGVPEFPENHMSTGKQDLSDQQSSADIREYAFGDPLSRIHWRQSARGAGLMTKQFDEGNRIDDLFLKLPDDQDYEKAISQLTLWVLKADRNKTVFSFQVPGSEALKGQGKAHASNCLQQLAFLPEKTGKAGL
ncbi:MAG: DUF58 domain-containing protein [Sneathiellales bacterium]|nr:DUF58 domain-containing protein [Sneathiellales bacterium]